MISSCKKLSADGTREILFLYSRVCGACVADPDMFVSSKDYLGVFGKGDPPCNAEDNLRAGHLVIEDD